MHRKRTLFRMLGILEDKKKMVKLKNTSKLCELIDFYLYSEAFKKLSGAAQQDYEGC